MQITVHTDDVDPMHQAVADVLGEFPDRLGDDGFDISLRRGTDSGLRITARDRGADVEYGTIPQGLRGLGAAMGELLVAGSVSERSEQTPFETITVMFDVSRNAVLTVDAVIGLIRRVALMGATSVMLYTEDIYEIPGEPYFGHARGRYAASELTAIDDAAARVGIELIPCIQTLGHLANVLQWPVYGPVRDNAQVLLVDEPKSYELVRAMLEAASAPVRSRRIHVGMDETYGIGSGAHRSRYGSEEPIELVNRHLRRVTELCDELGLQPMIWSDMYLKFASVRHDMHDLAVAFPAKDIAPIPSNVTLVHWDYLSLDEDHYVRQLERHQAAGHEPVFAAGVSCWSRLWSQNTSSIAALTPGVRAARRVGLAEVMVTTWGNDSSQADLYSTLPAIQHFCDEAYAGAENAGFSATNFRGSCDGTLRTWLLADDLDRALSDSDAGPDHPELFGNPGAWLLWSDPLLDLMPLPAEPLAPRFRQLADDLTAAAGSGTAADQIVSAVIDAARVLEHKVELHQRLRPAYRAGDMETVRDLLDRVIPAVADGVRSLRRSAHARWVAHNKVFGWEVLDLRYGGLLARLDTLHDTLIVWLADPTRRIEQLDVDQLPMFRPGAGGQIMRHDMVASPSPVN
ncbi:beta-N-acetylhexosaminidase [Occultella aeris]|uniref:Glycosyl hydrolase family 20, catalytic domain n=1 Tax=Occultella aeris TaxID=2761496 RepID=A0A7M4DDQ5_9MICO|nr:beta-N-acetylhexosaminidase [Occultella aeris]VZO34975.1 Glycosyl hydrolase family 20, catalytic domain [Occultella aeris]